MTREEAIEMGFVERKYRPWPQGAELLTMMFQDRWLDLFYRREDTLVYLGTVTKH